MKDLNKINPLIILPIILLFSIFLRFYNLENIPSGLHADEASQGYNAFSLIRTGKDMYGQRFPILFRADGSYQPPLYTYFSIIPVFFFGNTNFSIRFVSALSGTVLVILTLIFVNLLLQDKIRKQRLRLAIFSAATIAISPWAIHFSRTAIEANLAVSIFVLSLIVFLVSCRNVRYLPLAAFILGLSTHAYYSEGLISILLLPIFVILFRKIFFIERKVLIVTFLAFFITQIPHILLVPTGALNVRLAQVSSIGSLSISTTISRFFNQYLTYLSPGRLFFDPGSNLGKSSPELSVFYDWFLIPFLFGLRYFFKQKHEYFSKLIFILLFISLVPAALTGDVFYPLRTLDFLWVMTIIIAVGLFEIWHKMRFNFLRVAVFLFLFVYSFINFYISYFVLFKYEMPSANHGYALKQLAAEIPHHKNSKIWLDYSDRLWGAGTQLSYFLKTDPVAIQKSLTSQKQTPYYSSFVNSDEVYNIGNVLVKPIDWEEICGRNLILIGDLYSVNETQMIEHKLKLDFTISEVDGKPALFGYSTRRVCHTVSGKT